MTTQTMSATSEGEARERLALVGQMTSGVIHDVRNSLAVVRGAAELIEMTAPESEEYTGMILETCDQMVAMMQDLLLFARGGTATLETERHELGDFLQSIVASHSAALAVRGIDLVLVADCVSAEFDAAKLRRVLDNLIANARDAVGNGGRITLRAQVEAGELVIRVEDDGCGMSPDVAARMFEPFFTHGKANGTGFGTIIVSSIVEAHGGTVRVDSELGVGTTVSIALPLPAADEAAVAELAIDAALHADPAVRLECIDALGRLGGPRAVGVLAGLLTDPLADVRHAVARQLGRLGGRMATAALRGRLNDPVVYVRYAAAEALVALGDADGAAALRSGAVWATRDDPDGGSFAAPQHRPHDAFIPRRPTMRYAQP